MRHYTRLPEYEEGEIDVSFCAGMKDRKFCGERNRPLQVLYQNAEDRLHHSPVLIPHQLFGKFKALNAAAVQLRTGGGGGDVLPVTSSFIYSQLSDAIHFSRVEERRGDD
ncbi:unnamed protein product [Leuciscus chuanchicus]